MKMKAFYYCPGAHKITGKRQTLMDRIRLRKRRKRTDDLSGLKGRWGL